MPIHEHFAGLRDRLGVHGMPMEAMGCRRTVHTANTGAPLGVAMPENEKSSETQDDAGHETPATPETPYHAHDAHDWREMYEERAAIMEFDGGLPRLEAERLAYEFIQQCMKEEDRHANNQTMH